MQHRIIIYEGTNRKLFFKIILAFIKSTLDRIYFNRLNNILKVKNNDIFVKIFKYPECISSKTNYKLNRDKSGLKQTDNTPGCICFVCIIFIFNKINS